MKSKPSVEFIRMFFNSSAEEAFAVRCAEVLASLAGERIDQLRPDTKWAEILQWAGPTPVHVVLFAEVLKKEFGADAKEIIANSEFMTFREFVEYACSHEHHAAT